MAERPHEPETDDEPEPTTALGYTRLSDRSDLSIDRQKELIREYAAENDIELVRIINDGEYSSGFDTERDGYNELKDAIRAGDVDAVITQDRQRIGRDFDERANFIFLLRACDIGFHTAFDGAIELDDTYRTVFELMEAAKDDESKREEIKKSREAVKERIESGYYHGAVKYGTQWDETKRWLIPAENFETALEALALRHDGMSYRDICDETGINSTATPWTIATENADFYIALALVFGVPIPQTLRDAGYPERVRDEYGSPGNVPGVPPYEKASSMARAAPE